jgi:rhodanese-related sulfurtransferase
MPLTIQELVAQAKSEITEIDTVRAAALLERGAVFIDIREPAEWEKGMIPGALGIPRGVLEWRISSEPTLEDKKTSLVLYCQSGGRSALAANTLMQMGYDNVVSLAGGYAAWSEERST